MRGIEMKNPDFKQCLVLWELLWSGKLFHTMWRCRNGGGGMRRIGMSSPTFCAKLHNRRWWAASLSCRLGEVVVNDMNNTNRLLRFPDEFPSSLLSAYCYFYYRWFAFLVSPFALWNVVMGLPFSRNRDGLRYTSWSLVLKILVCWRVGPLS